MVLSLQTFKSDQCCETEQVWLARLGGQYNGGQYDHTTPWEMCVVMHCLEQHFGSMDNSIGSTVSWDRAIGPLKLHPRLNLPRGLLYTLGGFMTPTRDCSTNYPTTWQANQAEFLSKLHTGRKTKSHAELHKLQSYNPTIKINSGMIATKLTNQVDWCKSSGGKRLFHKRFLLGRLSNPMWYCSNWSCDFWYNLACLRSSPRVEVKSDVTYPRWNLY